jgi:serine/threonine-protein kinase
LKPDNIFLIGRGARADFVKVLDFGIAKVGSTGDRLTQAGQVFGTPHYMSPEQAAGTALDHRADVYALGVILYELITGRLPFDAESFMGILSQHMYKEPTAPSTLVGRRLLDPDLERIVLCCLKKAPEERYQTTHDLEADLRLIFSDVAPSSRRSLRLTALSGSAVVPYSGSRYRRYVSSRRVRVGLTAGLLSCSAVAAWAILAGPAPEASDHDRSEKSPAAPEPKPPVVVSVAIAVSPLEAHVFRGSEDLGQSPVTLEVGGHPVDLEVRAEGYASARLSVDGRSSRLTVKLAALAARAPTRTSAISTTPTPGSQRATKPPGPHVRSSEEAAELVDPWE